MQDEAIPDVLVRNCEVIRQIGVGSFSKVFLCKNTNLQLHVDESDLFIEKQIDVNQLVKNYMAVNNTQRTTRVRTRNIPTKRARKMSLTPYKSTVVDFEEQDYYYDRLHELINSEIDVLSDIDNEYIVRFYGSTQKRGIYYLRMEYCTMGDVSEYLRSNLGTRNVYNGMSSNFVYEFMNQMASALRYIHDKNIIHRDFKLQNILLDEQNGRMRFKLSDFGFACYDVSVTHQSDDTLSKKYFKLCGTPYYMAPEIVVNMNLLENIAVYKNRDYNSVFYDKRIDVWSYGICLYELVCNDLPFVNITTLRDLYELYAGENIQTVIDDKIQYCYSYLQPLLKNLLVISYTNRYTSDRLVQSLPEIDPTTTETSVNLVHCDNVHIKSESMRLNIVREPVVCSVNESWQRISMEYDNLSNTTVIDKVEGSKKTDKIDNTDKPTLLKWIWDRYV